MREMSPEQSPSVVPVNGPPPQRRRLWMVGGLLVCATGLVCGGWFLWHLSAVLQGTLRIAEVRELLAVTAVGGMILTAAGFAMMVQGYEPWDDGLHGGPEPRMRFDE